MRSLFVYWKVAPELSAAALQAARGWQAELRAAHPGLHTGLYRRSDAAARAEGSVTCMETYAVEGGVGPALQAAIDAAASAGLMPLGAPRRHVECFDAVDA